jgi:hypothetical protein
VISDCSRHQWALPIFLPCCEFCRVNEPVSIGVGKIKHTAGQLTFGYPLICVVIPEFAQVAGRGMPGEFRFGQSAIVVIVPFTEAPLEQPKVKLFDLRPEFIYGY